METHPSTLLTEHPEWQLVLQVYQAAEAVAMEQAAQERAAAKRASGKEQVQPETESTAEDESSDGESASEERERKQIWIRRIREVAGVSEDRLAPIHGRLIAEGLLHFSLGGRDEGVLYRLTREAKQSLAQMPELTADMIEDLAPDEDGAIPQAA